MVGEKHVLGNNANHNNIVNCSDRTQVFDQRTVDGSIGCASLQLGHDQNILKLLHIS